jgi:hypothetical protein
LKRLRNWHPVIFTCTHRLISGDGSPSSRSTMLAGSTSSRVRTRGSSDGQIGTI